MSDADEVQSNSKPSSFESVWDEPKLEPTDATCDLADPPLAQIRRGWLLAIAAGVVVAATGSVVYAIATRSTAAHTEHELQQRPYGTQRGRVPDSIRQLEMATKPATSADDSVTLSSGLHAPLTPEPLTAQAADDDGAAERAAAGYEPPSRFYGSSIDRSGPSLGTTNGNGPLVSSVTTAATDDDEAEADLPPRPKPKGETSQQPTEFTAPSLSGLSIPSVPSGQVGQLAATLTQDDDDRKEQFQARNGINTLEGDTEEIGECDLSAGTPFHVNVIVATNSDLPSGNTVTFVVNETVYCGADREHTAVPQGSKFHGEADQRVVYGQERIQLCMKQLDRPASLRHPRRDRKQLGCMVVADIEGAAGMPAEVDNHWGQLIAGALLSTVLSLGTTASMGNQEGFAPTLAQNAARSAGNNINQAGQRVVQRELQRKPTLTTKILEGVVVMFTSNLELDPWLPRKRQHRR